MSEKCAYKVYCEYLKSENRPVIAFNEFLENEDTSKEDKYTVV